MIIEICAIVAVIMSVVITSAMIYMVLCLRKVLSNLNTIQLDIQTKLHQLDSTFETIENIGDITQEEAKKAKIQYLIQKEDLEPEKKGYPELAEWLLASIKLSSVFLKRS